METWNEIIVMAIKSRNRPLKRREILDIVKAMGYIITDANLSVYISTAKRDGVIAYCKIPPVKVGYYCCPEWLDKNGKIKVDHKFHPYWSEENYKKLPEFLKNESNTNKSDGISNLGGSLGGGK